MKIISIRENPTYKDIAINYFQSKWPSVYPVLYEDSINHSIDSPNPLPQWYLLEKDNEIIGCAGLITNDFISRMDLYPWVCAVYIDENHRGHFYSTLLLEKAKEDISINIASVYLQVLFNEELYRVSLGQVELSKEQYNRIERLAEVGKASPAEVAEAKARVAQDEMNAVQANNDYRLALLDLSQLIELETPEGFLLEEPAVKIELAPLTPPDEIFQIALGSKASIQAAQYRLEGSKHSIRIAQSGYYPQLSFNGSLGTNYYSTINRTFSQQMSDNFNKYIGFNLSVPIFNRLATRNRVRTARLQRENYSLQLDNAKKNLYKEIQQAWYNAAASESKYTSSSTAASASKASFKLMSEKYENGKANAVEYNEAKQNLMKAQSDELQAKYEYLFRTKILDFYKGEPIE